MIVEYDSNNSGGKWWLDDSAWLALEKAGWEVEWGRAYFCHSPYHFQEKRQEGKSEPCKSSDACKGHRSFDSADACEKGGGRWLGALASKARKDFPSMRDAIMEWEKVTGLDATQEGCNCCGAPHTFEAGEGKDRQWLRGEDIVDALYPDRDIPRSRREMAERMGR